VAGKVYIGTSGWIYKHWKDNWYKGVRPKDYLNYMTSKFNALEANGTFYRLPKRESFEAWRANTPPDFRFAIKAHRFLTHRKKLKDVAEGIGRQKEAAGGLQEKLAVVVWQLPGNFRANVDRLRSFLADLQSWSETRHALEFRHESWFTSEVAAVLADHRIAVCISDAPKWPIWHEITTDLVYIRLHGHEYLYASPYSDEQLDSWADKIRGWRDGGCDVHVYFDNDWHANAPYDAEKLKQRLVSG
jgi:uncharacterized protein YecE (DUF72 family)